MINEDDPIGKRVGKKHSGPIEDLFAEKGEPSQADLNKLGSTLRTEHEIGNRFGLGEDSGLDPAQSAQEEDAPPPVPMTITKRGEISGSQKRVLTGGYSSGDLREGKVGRKRVRTPIVRSGKTVDELSKEKEAKDEERRGW